MFDAKPDLTFTFHSSQRERFRDGTLVSQWRSKYPELFDDDDVRVLKTDHQRTYHFFEWLSAILLFEATGCISLLETYLAKSHRRKRATVKKLSPSESLAGWTVIKPASQIYSSIVQRRTTGFFVKSKVDQTV